jgi:putative flippase GtrA
MSDIARYNGLQRLLQRLPETPRLVLVAIVGGLIGLLVYEIIYYLNPIEPRATSSWLLSFAVGVPRQHALHRWLTYVDQTPYWDSLKRAYALYTSLVVLTTSLNYLLVEELHVHHRIAWLICTTSAGAINLFVLKRFVYYHSHRGP